MTEIAYDDDDDDDEEEGEAVRSKPDSKESCARPTYKDF